LRLEELRLASRDPAWDPCKDSVRIAALLRTTVGNEGPLKSFAEWISKEARSPRAGVWFEILRDSKAGPNTIVALAALGRAGDVDGSRFTGIRWDGEVTLMAAPRRFVVRQLLEHGQSALARALVTQDDPLLVSVLAAQGDETGLRELFARLVRQSFPGGVDAVDYAEAFAKEGHPQLGGELYGLALDRLHATGGVLPPLVKSYARFLVAHRRFEEAENLLMREGQGLTDGLPEILVALYRGWNKLDRLDAELVKFHLPGGVREETRYQARRLQPAK